MAKEVHVNLLFIVLAILVIVLGATYIFNLRTPEEIQAEMPLSEIKAMEEEKPIEKIIVEIPEEPKQVEPKVAKPTFDELTKVVIDVFRDRFSDDEPTIVQGATIVWKNQDTRRHRMACYTTDGNTNRRFYFGEIMLEGGKNEYTFEEPGKFLCIDAVFGLRSFVTVNEKQAITGNYLLSGFTQTFRSTHSLSIMVFTLLAVALLFHVYKHEGHHFF